MDGQIKKPKKQQFTFKELFDMENIGKFPLPFFILISIFDIISSIVGIQFFGLYESNFYAMPLFYGLVACILWVLLEKSVFHVYKFFKFVIFPLWCGILFLPSLNNLVLIYGCL